MYVPVFVVPIGATARIVPTPGGVGGIETVNTTLVTLATGANAPRVLAGVTIHGVGGFVLTTTLGAVAIALIRVRGSRRARSQR